VVGQIGKGNGIIAKFEAGDPSSEKYFGEESKDFEKEVVIG
jgi:hypothetical protein